MSIAAGTRTPAVIFDLDGTLVDSVDDITASLNHALAAEGLPAQSRESVTSMVGDGAGVLVARAAPDADEAVQARVLATFGAHYADHCADRTRIYPGMDMLLDGLSSAGWPLAVLSNKPHDFTQRCTRRLLSRWHFAAVLGASDDVPRKPDPTAALMLADALGRTPAEVFFVGDSPGDVATGRSAGMVTISVAWGYRDVALLHAAAPDVLVLSPVELLNRLMAISRRA